MRRLPNDGTLGRSGRIVCGSLGSAVIVAAIVTLFVVRPFDYKVASLAVGATVPGMVLIAAAIWGRPPDFLL